MNFARQLQRRPTCKDEAWRELWNRLVFQHGYDKAKAKFHLTEAETRSDVMAWRYLGGRA